MKTVDEIPRRVTCGSPVDAGHGLTAWFWKDWSAGMRDGYAGASQRAVWYTGPAKDAFCIFDEQDGRAVLEFYLDDQEPVIIDQILPSQVVPMVRRLLCK
jgi:hypothetical protein